MGIMSEQHEPYFVLGVSRDADARAIKSAYRRLARRYHPDRDDSPGARERFIAVRAAFDLLRDPRRRALYDEFGPSSLADGFDPRRARRDRAYREHLRTVFDAPPSPPRRPARGEDLWAEIELGLVIALQGGVVRLRVEDREIEVDLPPGVRDGERLVIPGQGAPAPLPGGQAGDLLLEVIIHPHPVLRRDDLDLELDLPVTIPEALHGARVAVPTPAGPIEIELPAGVQSGTRLRLEGCGVRREDQRGDLFAVVQIRCPTRIDARARALAKALEAAYDTPVRRDLVL